MFVDIRVILLDLTRALQATGAKSTACEQPRMMQYTRVGGVIADSTCMMSALPLRAGHEKVSLLVVGHRV